MAHHILTGVEMRLMVPMLAAGLASCVGSSPESPASSEYPFDAFVEVDGVTLQYRDWGGEGPLMVLVPSVGMTAHSFETLAPHFTERYRVLGMTRRWHGASEQAGRNFDLDSLANDLGGFVEAFSAEPAVILGWGWATLEQATLARNRPDLVAALILANGVLTTLDRPEGLQNPPGQFAPDTVFASIEHAVEAWLPYLELDRAVLRELLAAALVQLEDGSYVWGPPVDTPVLGRFAELEDWSAELYEGIEAPVLAIQVRQAEYLAADLRARGFSSEDIAAAVRWASEFDNVRRSQGAELLISTVESAEVVILDGVSHNFVLESPEAVAEPVLDFLSRVNR